jgi:predicted MFS family arabinose efflux permease
MMSLPLLIVVALTIGVLSVLFEIAYLAYLPSLVRPERVGAANARLQASASVAQVGGPGIAGLLVGLIGAPLAMGIDAVSLLFAGLAISRIRRPEPAPDAAASRAPIVRSIADGLRFVLGQRMLRALAGEAGMFNVLYSGVQVAFLIDATSRLGFSPTELGLVYSIGGVGALVGSLSIGRIDRRFGYGRALVLAMLVGTVPFLGLGLVMPGPLALAAAAGSMLLGSSGVGAAIVLVLTLRQTAIPRELLGRSQATYRMLTYGAIPVGAIVGGALVDVVGAQGAVVACTAGIALAPIWILLSPLPRLRTLAEARIAMAPAATRPAAELAQAA